MAGSGHLWLQPGYEPFTRNPWQWLGRIILPWIAVAATEAGGTARLTRSAILDALGRTTSGPPGQGTGERAVFGFMCCARPSFP